MRRDAGERRSKDVRWSNEWEDEEERRGGRCQAQLLFKLWHGTSRSTTESQRALVDLFGVVEMLIGKLTGLPGGPLLQVFLHKLPPNERSGVCLARFSGLLSTVEGTGK
jgi:hypothetical protein